MIDKLMHMLYHARVIKLSPRLVAKIAAGYFNTLCLGKTVLRTIEFALLAECNSRCVMCYASKLKKENEAYVSVDEYRSIWAQASRMGTFSVILSGGEPTLRADLFDIVSVLDPHNTIIALVTNSLNLNKQYIFDLKKAGVRTIHLSLDSIVEKENDIIRGAPGHYRKVLESIENAKRAGMAVYLSTVIGHNGLDKMRQMTEFAQRNGVGIVFSLACVSGNWANERDVLLTEAEWLQVQSFMRDNPMIRSDWTINFSCKKECPGGREKVNVSCYGDVTGCGMNYVSFGNVRQEPLERIWRRMSHFPAFARRSPQCLIGIDRDYIEKYIRPLSDMQVPVQIDKHPTAPLSFADLDGQRDQQ